ncbi:MAG: hypothetical protein O2887_16070 [Bacteroidetes bacterium]|nr:hypothetical protein [Bacteroidota bacterium]MDA1121979.1 hypothetical protein [Bacteroidota bacterium]
MFINRLKKRWPLITLASIAILGLVVHLGILYHASILAVIHSNKLNRETLETSLKLGQDFLLKNQKADGSFNYEYDFINDRFTAGDNQVRQAGALWGLALIYQELPSEKSRIAIERSITFFENYTRQGKNGLFIAYPGDSKGRSGTVALVCLGIIDFLRAEPHHPDKPHYDSLLNGYLNNILSLQQKNKRFSASYDLSDGFGDGYHSPYYDGEILLMLCKAAKYLGYDYLKNNIVVSARSMYNAYVTEARIKDEDSDVTKGFYQWGSMSFYEIYTAGWDDQCADRTIELAYWMIDTHRTLIKPRNTAYAHEGMVSAWQLAKLTNDEWAMHKIGAVIDIGLSKLISWQVGGPLQNNFLLANQPGKDLAIGGFMNLRNEPLLRIDVTQHQCHAMILARRFIYSN